MAKEKPHYKSDKKKAAAPAKPAPAKPATEKPAPAKQAEAAE